MDGHAWTVMQPRSVLQQFLRPVSRAYPLPQQSGHHIDNPLHYIAYCINEAQRLLDARDTAIRDLQHARAQEEKQHNAEKSELQSQLWSTEVRYEAAKQQTIVMEQARMKQEHHSSKLNSSSTPADRPAWHTSDIDGTTQAYHDLEATLHSLQDEKRVLLEQHQADRDEWSRARACLSHQRDALQSALKRKGYELDVSGELTRCARRNTRKHNVKSEE